MIISSAPTSHSVHPASIFPLLFPRQKALGKAFAYLEELENGNVSDKRMKEMLAFLENDLRLHSDAAEGLEGLELLDYLYCKLNRPMRVCGMVRNVGEPGGGPFLAYNPDGTVSLQVLESSQIDMSDPEKKAMFENGTHFNPRRLRLRRYLGYQRNQYLPT